MSALSLFSFSRPWPSCEVDNQPASPAGGQHKSAWYPPDGLDGDEYAFDSFTLGSSVALNEVHWRGGYTNYLSGAGKSPAFDFDISIYRSIAGGSQPDLGTGGRVAHYTVGGNAGETAVGTFGGVIMYDYAFTLPSPFQAVGGSTYWLQIEASPGVTPTYGWPPDWSLAAATGGNNWHFRKITGGGYQAIGGDLAFSVLRRADRHHRRDRIPDRSRHRHRRRAYPINSTVSLLATPNTGWGFVNWTENGSPVSSNAHYTFNSAVDRTLVANLDTAYTVTTKPTPTYGGTITEASTTADPP